MATPFKFNPLFGAAGQLQARANMWRRGPHYKASVRNPCYCVVSGGGKTLPVNDTTFAATYNSFKLHTTLTTVTVNQGNGGFGLTSEAEIVCTSYTKGQFEEIKSAWMNMHTVLTIKFGYALPYGDGYGKGASITGLMVCGFSFETTQEGFWISKIKAICPSTALLELEIGTMLSGALRSNTFQNEGSSAKVTGLTELMQCHATANGSTALDAVADGHCFKIERSKGSEGMAVVCDLKLARQSPSTTDAISTYFASFLPKVSATGEGSLMSTGGTAPERDIYFTLEYIINLYEYCFKPSITESAGSTKTEKLLRKLKIIFDPTYSFSYIDPMVTSGRPQSVVLISPSGEKGKYGTGGGVKLGYNFETVSAASQLNCVVGGAPGKVKIDVKKILVNISVINAALAQASTKRVESEDNSPAKTEDVTLKLDSFYSSIFDAIATATGGAIRLRLSAHPKSFTDGKDYSNILIVADENNGFLGEPIKVIRFNPIDGDGSTRSCALTSEAGGRAYGAQMFAGTRKSAETADAAMSKDHTTSNRTGVYSAAVVEFREARDKKYPESGWAETVEKSMLDTITTISRGYTYDSSVDLMTFPSIGINVQIDGVWGIVPGCGITSTQVPNDFVKNKCYFTVTDVVHTFDGSTSDWSTSLTGQTMMDRTMKIVDL